VGEQPRLDRPRRRVARAADAPLVLVADHVLRPDRHPPHLELHVPAELEHGDPALELVLGTRLTRQPRPRAGPARPSVRTTTRPVAVGTPLLSIASSWNSPNRAVVVPPVVRERPSSSARRSSSAETPSGRARRVAGISDGVTFHRSGRRRWNHSRPNNGLDLARRGP